MVPEGSLPHLQEPATCPYPEPAQSSPYPHIPLPERSISILSPHLRLGLPSGLFTSGFPTQTLYTPLLSPIRTTCPDHSIFLDLSPEKFWVRSTRSFSSSLYSFLHSLLPRPILSLYISYQLVTALVCLVIHFFVFTFTICFT